jgi:DNA-binding IclR family transcriptional regulator
LEELNDGEPEFLDAETLAAQPQFASTLANGLAVLGCFGTGSQSVLGNKDFAERLQLTRPTVSRLTFTLMGLGYLRRDRASGKYALGPAVLSLGYPLLSQLTVRQIASPEMLELARYARGPVSIGTRDRLQVVYVETIQAYDSNATKPDIGSTRPFLRTAIGRALLASYSEPQRAALLGRLRAKVPDEWQQHHAAAAQACIDIAEQQFCVVAGDWRPTLAAVAVPMQASAGAVHLAFNLTVPSYATDAQHLQRDLGPRLVTLVRSIEYKLGLDSH